MTPSLEMNNEESTFKALIDAIPDAEAEPEEQTATDLNAKPVNNSTPIDFDTILVDESIQPVQSTPKAGFVCEVINFYPDREGNWSQKYPYHIQEAPENDETAQYAILKRNQKSSDPRKKFELHSIVIQSPLIKKVLGKVFEGYSGICTDLDRLEFEAPFRPFVYRWERLRRARAELIDLEERDHLKLLWDILEKELKLTLATRDDLLAHRVITYDYLWTLFEPHSKCLITEIVGESKTPRIFRFRKWQYTNCGFSVVSRFVDWSGEEFGMGDWASAIMRFEGSIPIHELDIFPLKFHPQATALQKQCIARGREWESLCKYTFTAYKGPGTNNGRRYNVDSRVILDTHAYNQFNPNETIWVSDLEYAENFEAPKPEGPEQREGQLSPWQLMLATHHLRGYSLKDKVWLTLAISNFVPITWNEQAFKRLVLPDDTKDLVLAFAQSQLKRQSDFDDVIKGKGQGVIMLLTGPPGVGKTLTAEAVAETMRVPLYMMAAGDLGTTPWEVEENLSKILKMTTKWKAVLLLDEADVYLEARSTHDLERNKLVSIFLRNLEYYEGFLFLTSNRVDNIDAAFESRIHLSLMYGGLSFESRRQVWQEFLNISAPIKISSSYSIAGDVVSKASLFTDEQIDALAKIELNGRQIKNILKTAQLLACSKDAPLSFSHVQTITKLRAANACIPLKGEVESKACACRG